MLRRERDSNSRTSFAGHTLSRRASSATRASLPLGGALLGVVSIFALFGYKDSFFSYTAIAFRQKVSAIMRFFIVLNALLLVYELKYTLCVVVCDIFCLLFAYIIYLCNFAQCFCHKCTLVSLAAIGDRSEIGSIRFEDDAF